MARALTAFVRDAQTRHHAFFRVAERAVAALVGYSAGAAVVLPFDRVKSLVQVERAADRALGQD